MKKEKLGLRLEWMPYRCERGWLDTFVHRVSATDGLPPAAQAKIIEGIAKQLGRLRGTSNLHVSVDSPGKWFINETKRVCDPVIAVVITWEGNDFVPRGLLGGYPTLWAALEPPFFSLLEANNIRALKKKEQSKFVFHGPSNGGTLLTSLIHIAGKITSAPDRSVRLCCDIVTLCSRKRKRTRSSGSYGR